MKMSRASAHKQEEVEPCQVIALFDVNELVLGEKVGSGGFCRVFEAKSLLPRAETDFQLSTPQVKARAILAHSADAKASSTTPYVIKILRPELSKSDKKFRAAARDIDTEVDILSQVSHPNIINLRGHAFDLGSNNFTISPQRYFMILDRVDMTLKEKVKEWALQTERLKDHPVATRLLGGKLNGKHLLVERLRVAAEIASALEHLHSKGFVYRDLKPTNVGIDSNNSVKLFDFGLTTRLPSEDSSDINDTYKMSGVGTYRFMPPEVAMSKPYNEKVDVYSYSLLLYSILSLQKVFPLYSKKIHRMRVVKGNERPPIDSHWHKEIQDLLERAWSPEISKRPSMAEIGSILQSEISKTTAHSWRIVMQKPLSFRLPERKQGSKKCHEDSIV